jgi:hypothetical protein
MNGFFQINAHGQAVFVPNVKGDWCETSRGYARTKTAEERETAKQPRLLCPGCSKLKALSQFSVNLRSKSGRMLNCIPCENIKNAR